MSLHSCPPLRLLMMSLIFLAADVMAVNSSEYAVVINLAGRQRMLTQKMSKEMLLVAKGIDVEANRGELAKTAWLFDTTLEGLLDGSNDLGLPPTNSAATRRQLGRVETLWREFHTLVNQVVDGEDFDVARVATLNMPLLRNMDTVVGMYEREASKATGRRVGVVINLAGKQRMLTQKMSKEVLLVALQHDADNNRSNARNSASLFNRTLKGLKDGDAELELPKTEDLTIREQLDRVDALWQQFRPLIIQAAAGGADLSSAQLGELAVLNLPLLTEMSRAVKMYEQAEH